MYSAYAKIPVDFELLQFCDTPFSFYKLIDSIWKGSSPYPDPLHRLYTLMRKMKVKSFIKEDLVLNQELQDEREIKS